jgi:catalase (peroxidase I)
MPEEDIDWSTETEWLADKRHSAERAGRQAGQ